MTAPDVRRRRRALAQVATLAVLTVACAPPDDLAVGLNEVHTNVVFGAAAKDPATVEPPSATAVTTVDLVTPAPSFIAPAPVVSPLPSPGARPDPVRIECPSAGLFDVPAEAGTDVEGAPAAGVYPFEQTGVLQRAGQPPIGLPAVSERTIRDVSTTSDGDHRYVQVVQQFGARTSTTYRLTKGAAPGRVVPNANASSEGIYLSSVVTERPGGTVERFEPASPGLRIFPTPAELGAVWDSVAVDARHRAAMRLSGTIIDRFRIDACGELVEGWRSSVTIEVASADSSYVVRADYVVIPQLGGLIGADKVELKGSYHGVETTQISESSIRRLAPVRPVPPA